MPFALPKLTVMQRELAQIAARKSTYITRTIFGTLMAGLGLIFIAESVQRFQRAQLYGGNAFILGAGEELIYSLTVLTASIIMLVLPSMVIGSVTTEREQGTLDLMRISRLTPWEIVLQKFFARLVPFSAFLLLMVPMGAIAYALGGVSIGESLGLLVILISLAMRVTAISLLCSAFATSTSAAFLLAYALLAALFIGVPFLAEGWFHGAEEVFVWWFAAPWIDSSFNWPEFFIYCALHLGSVVLLLVLTRLLIVRSRRTGNGAMKRLHNKLDRYMETLNHRFGNIRWGAKRRTLPADNPVAWRERTSAALLAPEHRFRILCVILVPAFWLLPWLGIWSNGDGESFTILLMILWLAATLVLTIYAANLIPAERSRESLDVLLTTPLSASSILKQKLAATPWLIALVTIPLLLTIGFKYWHVYVSREQFQEGLIYLALSLAMICVYPWLTIWSALHLSLHLKKRATVVMCAMLQAIAFIAGPMLPAFLLHEVIRGPLQHEDFLIYANPIGAFAFNEWEMGDRYYRPQAGWQRHVDWDSLIAVVAGLLLYAIIGAITRHRCLRNADRFLYGKPARPHSEDECQ
jgi:ABC-type transport system involved in multi-copper enzyme maturation permease subunit